MVKALHESFGMDLCGAFFHSIEERIANAHTFLFDLRNILDGIFSWPF